MNDFSAGYEYVESSGFKLFTVILKPADEGEFPTMIFRNPYVSEFENADENAVVDRYSKEFAPWCENGYVVVVQHCRGKGKSEGTFLPFEFEREDGLNLQEWVRHQDFYNGEIFLVGISYTSVVHCETAPFADDIKGMISTVQDCNRYNFAYRNGVFKKGLFGDWFVTEYKSKTLKKKNYSFTESFEILPFKDFSKTVLGEKAETFDNVVEASDPNHGFWKTHVGGKYSRNAVRDAKIPVLLATGFYDIFTSGIFDMWNSMDEKTKAKSALVVSPYDHVDGYNKTNSIHFENGTRAEQFGANYEIDWCDYVRGKKASPFESGKVTYYRLFENVWATDEFLPVKDSIKIKLGEEEKTYKYDPDNAPGFPGGLSCNFGGGVYQEKPYQCDDVVTIYTDAFPKDVFVKGKMTADLKVKSDCEDTCFYMRLSITKDGRDFGLRDDIHSLCYQLGDYEPNSEVSLKFTFDEHAFLIKKGEKLRIDITSADRVHYVPHTNTKGPYYEQTTKKIANNTVYLNESFLTIPIEVK